MRGKKNPARPVIHSERNPCFLVVTRSTTGKWPSPFSAPNAASTIPVLYRICGRKNRCGSGKSCNHAYIASPEPYWLHLTRFANIAEERSEPFLKMMHLPALRKTAPNFFRLDVSSGILRLVDAYPGKCSRPFRAFSLSGYFG